MQDALPVRAVFARRLRVPPPPCELCGQEEDDVSHVLFKCEVARNYWFSSHLAIRADALPGQVMSAINLLMQQLGKERFMVFANLLWSFWKARCKQIYEGVRINVKQVLGMAVSLDSLAKAVGNQRCITKGEFNFAAAEIDRKGRVCIVDGSFKEDGMAGWAHMFYEEGDLVGFEVRWGKAASPFHAEALAFQAAVRRVQEEGWSDATFYTDSHLLARILNGFLSPESIDWRAYGLVIDLIADWKGNSGFRCFATPRENLLTVHRLANLARVQNLNAQGSTFPLFPFVT
ncbi:hypothetical protein LUZ62_041409 [Rhynchospora pubera]|uniref:RNase H type-1 domain-containing protein n=1 Tax=Rhynchospora pubera TaxID=906938 RepID=A0AAV8FHM5_9POAL|nr:hypothetical protein LUZ62_041409 [Rhynchospora pubera]